MNKIVRVSGAVYATGQGGRQGWESAYERVLRFYMIDMLEEGIDEKGAEVMGLLTEIEVRGSINWFKREIGERNCETPQ